MFFIINSLLMGFGLAMDAFSVSVATSIVEYDMKRSRMCLIAGTFGVFQIVMPLLGWLMVHTASGKFLIFERAVPYIALILLCIIGGNMIREALGNGKKAEVEETAGGPEKGAPEEDRLEEDSVRRMVGMELFGAGIATSIDALSVGFAIASSGFGNAAAESLIIGATTFVLCLLGLSFGRRLGNRFSGKAQMLGGAVLVFIGVEIFLRGVF